MRIRKRPTRAASRWSWAIRLSANLQLLVDGVEDAQSEKKVMMYFLRRVPRDPFFPDAIAAPADTWGLRSSKSPPTIRNPAMMSSTCTR